MKVERRIFLRWLAAAGVSAALPIPKVLLPKVQEAAAAEGAVVTIEEINTLCAKHIMPGLSDLIFRNSPFLEYIGNPACQARWNDKGFWEP